MSVLQKLTEGVQSRDMQAEGAALLNKWEATGLLEGLNEGQHKQGMAVLLENQAKELLREASAMAAGDVEGFAAVAFPIVRRVFGGLIANDLVSVQPMSLPSGLIFFLDFVKSDAPSTRPGDLSSIYGGNIVARQLTGGVDLGSSATSVDAGGFYDFNTGYSHATGAVASTADTTVAAVSGFNIDGTTTDITAVLASETLKKALDYDPDILSLPTSTKVLVVDVGIPANLNRNALGGVVLENAAGVIEVDDKSDAANVQFSSGTKHVKRLTKLVDTTGDGEKDKMRLVFINAAAIKTTENDGSTGPETLAASDGITIRSYPIEDSLAGAGHPTGLGAIEATSMPLENAADMAEIDIKVDSIAVTAQTKKLKAKWSPELGQDLNAYHNLDAEVELTGILSEQIALEIDRELLGDLVQGATAGTRYWSRAPGLFVDSTGAEVGHTSAAPDFTGTVSEWYETLIETINDVSAQIHRKTLRGGANFVVCSPEVANILEFTSGFRASVTADQDRGTIGAVKSGSLSKKFDVYVDPYFLRNVILVGRKGSSFLESGFVYAPYVPLQVTPTIFGTEDFVPRKGVMTRYAKKMVRPDMYGLVVVRGLLGEAGQ